jgi:hypothetical protein
MCKSAILNTYRATFERWNFTFTPALKQIVDVAFQLSLEDVGSNQNVDSAAHNALYEQFPNWKGSKCNLDGSYGGWSSVMMKGGVKFVDRNMDVPNLGELGASSIPRICEIIEAKFNDDHTSIGRVEGYFKTYTPKEKKYKSAVQARTMKKLMAKIKAERPKNVIRIISCDQVEAEFVCAGTIIARLEDCTVTGLVDWDARTIQKERDEYTFIGDESPIEITAYWKKSNQT